MRIEIKPIEKKKWHGKTGKESFTRPVKITALVNADQMTYSVELNEEERTEYSEKLKKDLSVNYDPEKSHEFWDSALATVKLENATKILDTEKPIEFIHYRILRASKYVANSMKEYEEGLFPDATHVIYDEKEEIEVKAKKIAIRDEVVIKSAELSKTEKEHIIMVLAQKDCKGKSDDFVRVELSKLIDSKPSEVLRLINTDNEAVALKSLVLECLQKSVLNKEGHKIKYFESVLGGDVDEVVSYLKKEDNQHLKLRLLDAVNN